MLSDVSENPDKSENMSGSATSFEDLSEEEIKKLRHRGRASHCNTCLVDEGKMVILEKVRMEAHIYKKHVAPSRVPFRCTLCQFRCTDKETLHYHVKHYAPHAKATKGTECGIREDCLKESACPYYVTEADYHVYSSE